MNIFSVSENKNISALRKLIKDLLMSVALIEAESPQARYECGLAADSKIPMLIYAP